jgi:uncharacterized protein
MRIVYEITRKCNINCLYCYEGFKKTKPKKESEEQLLEPKNFVEFIQGIAKTNPYEKIIVQFHGGEPFLEFPRIKEIIERTQKIKTENINKRIEFVTTTNGTLLNEDIVDWCSKNDLVKFSLSHDIISNITQELRHPSLDKEWLLKKLDLLLKYETKPSIAFLISKKHIELGAENFVKELSEIYNYVKKYNYEFTSFRLDPIVPFPYLYYYVEGIYNDNDLQLFYNKILITPSEFLKFYAECIDLIRTKYTAIINTTHKNILPLFERNAFYVFQQYYSCYTDFIDTGIPCKMGEKYLGVAPNGDLYPCIKLLDIKNKFNLDIQDFFYLGNIKSVSFDQITKNISSFKKTIYNILYNHNLPCTLFCDYSETCSYCIIDNYILNNYFDSSIGSHKCLRNINFNKLILNKLNKN